MMRFPIYGKIENVNQTTNQIPLAGGWTSSSMFIATFLCTVHSLIHKGRASCDHPYGFSVSDSEAKLLPNFPMLGDHAMLFKTPAVLPACFEANTQRIGLVMKILTGNHGFCH